MDLDTLLTDSDLPSVATDTEAALVGAVERGRRRRRGRQLAAGAATLTVVGCVIGLAVAVDHDDSHRVVAGPPPMTAVPTEPEPGDVASWTVRPGQVLDPAATTFSADVVRETCNDGVTGPVLRPGVVVTDAEVVVTFTVEPSTGMHRCPGNPPVSYEVDIGQPIGDRVLVDGSCGQTQTARNGTCVRYAFRSIPGAGDPAVWDIDPDDPPEPNASTFAALVQRVACNSGVTGRVLVPVITIHEEEIVVTFLVETDLDGGECPSNDAVPYEVDVGEPIGGRTLVDGACVAPDVGTTAPCREGEIRWP
jgi:hypothetical protein